MSLLDEAILFAIEAHKEQKRKFDGTSYIRHPLSVMGIMSEINSDPAALAACALHDTVEDCADITLEVIHERFGEIVTGYVFYATEKSTKKDGSRHIRKQIDNEHYRKGLIVSQNIKVADAMDNVPSMFFFDKNFAIQYTKEKIDLLEVLDKADQTLKNKAFDLFIKCLNLHV